MPEDSVEHGPDEPVTGPDSARSGPGDGADDPSTNPPVIDALPDAIDSIPDPIAEEQVAQIVAEEEAAARRTSAIEAGRRKGGVAGAAMAGAMLAISDIVEGPKRDEIVAVSETPDEPDDIDVDGITVSLDGRDFWAPPPDGTDGGERPAAD